jgi:hypothetical protein
MTKIGRCLDPNTLSYVPRTRALAEKSSGKVALPCRTGTTRLHYKKTSNKVKAGLRGVQVQPKIVGSTSKEGGWRNRAVETDQSQTVHVRDLHLTEKSTTAHVVRKEIRKGSLEREQ